MQKREEIKEKVRKKTKRTIESERIKRMQKREEINLTGAGVGLFK
jgi:hypothetical protein